MKKLGKRNGVWSVHASKGEESTMKNASLIDEVQRERRGERYQSTFDFAADLCLNEFLSYLDMYPGARIERWVTIGPGGGNPAVTISFPSREAAEGAFHDHNGTGFSRGEMDGHVTPV